MDSKEEEFKIGDITVDYDIWLAHKRELDKIWQKNVPIFFIIFIIFILGTGYIIGEYLIRNRETDFKIGYIEACKDFHKGNVKADLIEDPCGERKWVFNNSQQILKIK